MKIGFLNNRYLLDNGDISKWDVGRVVVMSKLFTGSKFNGDISKWDVSNVVEMEYIF